MQNIQSQHIRNLVDKLTEFGVQRYIELPQIAVMGDTSSGKSSVLTALSGIQFPSSDLLTTRCPTQLILSHAESFSGKVHIQRFEDKTLGDFAQTVDSVQDISALITALTQQLISEGQTISDDAIVIEASGPDLPNLTLTDLPGLVRAVSDGEDIAIIPRVRSLVNRYLNQSRTIILAVVPANVDMHNTEILQAANEADPEGDRTISIITKLDLVDKGAEDSVIKLLNNETKKIKLGYHAVKCRGQQALRDGKTIAQGLEDEVSFFKDTRPWNSVGEKRVGICSLREKLVGLLERRISELIPTVCKEIRVEIESATADVEAMGISLSDSTSRRTLCLSIVGQLDNRIRSAVSGGSADALFKDPKNRLRPKLSKAESQFNSILLKDKVKTNEDLLEVGTVVEVECDDGDWEIVESVSDSEVKVKRVGGNEILSIQTSSLRTPMDHIVDMIQQCRGEELAIFPSYDVFVSLVRDVVSKWQEPMNDLAAIYEASLRNVTELIVRKGLDQCPFKYRSFLYRAVSDLITELMSNVKVALTQTLEMEQRPYTLNHYLYDILFKLRNEPLHKALNKLKLNDGSDQVSFTAVMATLENFGVGTESNERHEAYQLLLAVAAYEKVAKKRFIDAVPNLLDFHLLKAFVMKLRPKLESITDDHLSVLFSEEPDIVENRQKLEKKLAVLKLAEKEISRFRY